VSARAEGPHRGSRLCLDEATERLRVMRTRRSRFNMPSAVTCRGRPMRPVKLLAVAVVLLAVACSSGPPRADLGDTARPTLPANVPTVQVPPDRPLGGGGLSPTQRKAYLFAYRTCRLESPKELASDFGWKLKGAIRAVPVAIRFASHKFSNEVVTETASLGCIDSFRGHPKRPRVSGTI
jgi:hypothetical protein